MPCDWGKHHAHKGTYTCVPAARRSVPLNLPGGAPARVAVYVTTTWQEGDRSAAMLALVLLVPVMSDLPAAAAIKLRELLDCVETGRVARDGCWLL